MHVSFRRCNKAAADYPVAVVNHCTLTGRYHCLWHCQIDLQTIIGQWGYHAGYLFAAIPNFDMGVEWLLRLFDKPVSFSGKKSSAGKLFGKAYHQHIILWWQIYHIVRSFRRDIYALTLAYSEMVQAVVFTNYLAVRTFYRACARFETQAAL